MPGTDTETGRTFGSDLALGKQFKATVRAVLGGTQTTPEQFDLGDIELPGGAMVECKFDRRFDDTGNFAVELADIDQKNNLAIVTGVLKHASHGLRSVIVHGLGAETKQVLVYSPYDMACVLDTYGDDLPYYASVKKWPNHTNRAADQTIGLLLPAPSNWAKRTRDAAAPPVQVVTDLKYLSHAVHKVIAWKPPALGASWTDIYRRLVSKSADQFISRHVAQSCVVLKGQPVDQVHAVLRREQATVG